MSSKICRRMMTAMQPLRNEGGNILEGVAVPYDRLSYPIMDEGTRPFRERIRAGALRFDGSTVMHVQHDRTGVPLARVGAGTLTLEESADGLRFRASLPESRMDVLEALERGDLDGSVSIGFIVDDDEWTHTETNSLREVTSGRLIEVSIVTAGAYGGAVGTFSNGGKTNG